MLDPSRPYGLDMLIDLWVEAALRGMEAERASSGERATVETEIADHQRQEMTP